ncbi:MAG: nickel pincer cofactor biosynthesis protein LarC [candidate division NC10 bacterium]|nr:nickel pincer cofactor biosynthesis protein LarC [candidate division NC10 bacterium]
MRIAYFDCYSGISGDMILGALVDAGVPLETLRFEVKKLRLPGVDLKAEKTRRGEFVGTRVHVITPQEPHPHRHLSDILTLLEKSELAEAVLIPARRIFERLGEAEAAVHGVPVERIHFHEVGALDTVVDVTGALIGLNTLGIHEIYASALNVGGGKVQAAHGELPIPAPGTAHLLRGIPVYGSPVEAELTTPTGAAIISTLAKSFGALPPLTVDQIGYGAGSLDLPGRANLLRLIVGERIDDLEKDEVTVLETNIDDMNPQLYEPLMEALFEAGALDVFLTPIIMKKSRPATVVSVIVPAGLEESIGPILLRFSSTFGVRSKRMHRQTLPRETVTVQTRFGEVRVKVGRLQGRPIHLVPEYEDCRRLAEIGGIPPGEIMAAAVEAARAILNPLDEERG